MGFIIVISITVIILLILGLKFLNDENKIFLLFLILGIIPILGIAGASFSNESYRNFVVKYEYVTNINVNELNSLDAKCKYYNDVLYINNEIDYAIKNSNSFWYGIFTDERLKLFKKIEI